MDPKTTGLDGSKKQTPSSPVHKRKGKVILHPLHALLCTFYSGYTEGRHFWRNVDLHLKEMPKHEIQSAKYLG